MSLADRRSNVPRLDDLPTFNIITPTRGIPRALLPPGSAESQTPSVDALPAYEVVITEDDNPDVITTSIEIDPEDDDADTIQHRTPPAVRSNLKTNDTRTKKRSIRKLFQKSSIQWDLPLSTPGIRMTSQPMMIRSRTKDIRHGFPLAVPILMTRCDDDGNDGTTPGSTTKIQDIDPSEWLNIVSRINILLSSGNLNDVQALLDSHPALVSSSTGVTFTRLSEAKAQQAEKMELTAHDPAAGIDTLGDHDFDDLLTPTLSNTTSSSCYSSLLTVPELNPWTGTGYDSDESAGSSRQSLFDASRRGSAVSTTSSTASTRSIRSTRLASPDGGGGGRGRGGALHVGGGQGRRLGGGTVAQRIRDKFERREEWCLLLS